MARDSHADLDLCLAYVVLNDYERWIGEATPTALQAFLAGASVRASLTQPTFPAWRIDGPLEQREFYQPLVARTGHLDLTIKWATAMEIFHYSPLDAMDELRRCVRGWFESRGFDTERVVGREESYRSPDSFWNAFARSPAVYMGRCTGWLLHSFLKGMDEGGDWLNLPEVPRLREVVDGIEQRSHDHYGSRFAAYRVYQVEPGELLGWAGLTG